jgi:hypothetical protein
MESCSCRCRGGLRKPGCWPCFTREDVDGFHALNLGALPQGRRIRAGTPAGVMRPPEHAGTLPAGAR